ncbi:MAG: hypothetical protein JNM93_06675 [Bacteriovoracaceae bacterium]|nr:hypothetical protein [Bacteriovoracaceae bacterium]
MYALTSKKLFNFEIQFVILGGLFLIIPFIFFYDGLFNLKKEGISWYFWTNALVSSPHVHATYVRLQGEISSKHVSFFWGVPAYLLCAILLWYFYQKGLYVEAITFINVWQSYHYLRQTYGVHRYFIKKENEELNYKRMMFWAFHLPMPYLILGRWHTLHQAWGGRVYNYLKPVLFPEFLMNFLFVIFILAVFLGLIIEIKRSLKLQKFENLLIFVAFIGIHYYGFVMLKHFHRGFLAVTLFHAVQYLAFVWIFEKKRRANTFFGKMFTQKFAVFFLCLLIWAYPVENYAIPYFDYYIDNFALFMLWAISLHHYMVDGLIWKQKAIG